MFFFFFCYLIYGSRGQFDGANVYIITACDLNFVKIITRGVFTQQNFVTISFLRIKPAIPIYVHTQFEFTFGSKKKKRYYVFNNSNIRKETTRTVITIIIIIIISGIFGQNGNRPAGKYDRDTKGF